MANYIAEGAIGGKPLFRTDPLGKAIQKSGDAAKKNTAKTKRDAFSGKVYVLQQGKLSPIDVTLGITDSRNTEIVAGELKAGDQVVVGETLAAGSASSGGSPLRMKMF